MIAPPVPTYSNRIDLISKVSKACADAPVLVYATSGREGASGNVRLNATRRFSMELRPIGVSPHLVLYISTFGGETRAAWHVVNLLRAHCKKLTVVIGGPCLSAGTLMALGANEIVMGRHATLSPVDPSFYVPLNTGQGTREVSVEDVASLLTWSRDKAGLRKGESLRELALRLADDVGPLMLGRVHRAHNQIRSLASRLLGLHRAGRGTDAATERIVRTLCEGLYAHDHLLARDEAKELGLSVVVPDENLEDTLWNLEESLNQDFEVDNPFTARTALGANTEVDIVLPIGFLESESRGHVWLQEGKITGGPGAVTTLPSGIPMPTGTPSDPIYTIERRRWVVHRP